MPSVSTAHADVETSTVGVSQNSNSQSTRASREIIGADGSRIQVPNDIREESSHSYPTVEAGRAGTAAATSSKTLLFRNGVHGVIHGSPRVYLVFLGSEWGTQLNSPGATTLFSTDNLSMPYSSYLHKLLQGLGTSGDTWSNVMTQYCDNSGAIKVDTTVAPNNCLAGTVTTGLPAATGALAGVWYDSATATAFSGTTADNNVLANEAVAAAFYFKTKDSLFSIENSQIVIASPKGTHPGGFNTPASNWCAWHSAATSASIGGSVAFTNLPYMTDMGALCGANLVNAGAAGALDGVSIVEGHEYAETLSDAIPNTGWVASNGSENGDNCSWITPYGNITTSTGTFAMQSTWSNATNSCQMSAPAPVVAPPALTFSTTTPPSTAVTGTSYSYTFAVTSTSTVTYSAGTLPSGLVLNPSTGVLSGTPTSVGTFSITITASAAGYSNGLLTFTLKVSAPITLTSSATLTAGTVGTAYTSTLSASGTPAPTFTLATGSALPAGLKLATTGAITGTPTASGTFTFTVNASNSVAPTLAQPISLTINAAPASPVAFTSVSPTATAKVGTAYSYTFVASGSPTPITFSVASGSLPTGLSLSTGGVLSGTPSAAGSFSFTVKATNGSTSATSSTLTILLTPTIATTGTPIAQTGSISGTGTATVTIKGTNLTGPSTSVGIYSAGTLVATVSNPTLTTAGTSLSFAVTAAGQGLKVGTSYTFKVTSGGLTSTFSISYSMK